MSKTVPGGGFLDSAAGGRALLRAGKTSPSEKNFVKRLGKNTFGNIANAKAVRKGKLLRDMVSQGRPHPLRLGVKVFRSYNRTKNSAELYT